MRRAYLAALAVIQLALVIDAALPLAAAMRAEVAVADSPHLSWAVLRFVTIGIALAGVACALAGPLLAMLRHQQRGAMRFAGLPRPAVIAAISGAAAVVGSTTAQLVGDHLPIDLPAIVEDWLPAARHAALAVAVGGSVAAETLRRSVAPPRLIGETLRPRQVSVQVVAPDELRTLPI